MNGMGIIIFLNVYILKGKEKNRERWQQKRNVN